MHHYNICPSTCHMPYPIMTMPYPMENMPYRRCWTQTGPSGEVYVCCFVEKINRTDIVCTGIA